MLKDFTNATEFFEQVIDLDPKNTNAYISIIDILILIKNFKLAKKYLTHTLKISKDLNLDQDSEKKIEAFKQTLKDLK